MSFIRPELAAALSTWREPVVWGGVGLFGAALLWHGVARDALLLMVLGGLLALTGMALLPGAIGRARLAALPPGEGVVMIDEGRIAFFGPHSGGFLDIESMERVEVVPGTSPSWRLLARDGTRLDIPFAARGAEKLPDALGALPGIAIAAALALIDSPAARPRTIWRAGPSMSPPISAPDH